MSAIFKFQPRETEREHLLLPLLLSSSSPSSWTSDPPTCCIRSPSEPDRPSTKPAAGGGQSVKFVLRPRPSSRAATCSIHICEPDEASPQSRSPTASSPTRHCRRSSIEPPFDSSGDPEASFRAKAGRIYHLFRSRAERLQSDMPVSERSESR